MFYLMMHSVREEIHYHHYMGSSFQLAARFFFIYHPTQRIAHIMAFVTPVIEIWLQLEIAQWVHHERSI